MPAKSANSELSTTSLAQILQHPHIAQPLSPSPHPHSLKIKIFAKCYNIKLIYTIALPS